MLATFSIVQTELSPRAAQVQQSQVLAHHLGPNAVQRHSPGSRARYGFDRLHKVLARIAPSQPRIQVLRLDRDVGHVMKFERDVEEWNSSCVCIHQRHCLFDYVSMLVTGVLPGI